MLFKQLKNEINDFFQDIDIELSDFLSGEGLTLNIVFSDSFVDFSSQEYSINMLLRNFVMDYMNCKIYYSSFDYDSLEQVRARKSSTNFFNDDLNDLDEEEDLDIDEEENLDEYISDEDDDVYKLIRIKENDYSGYLVAIYDPSRISLVTSSNIEHGGQTMEAISYENEAMIAINASGFARKDGALIPTGTVIQNGEVVSVGGKNTHGGGLIGFTKNNVLMLTTDSAEVAIKKGMYNGMTFGPFLIVNGVSSDVKGNGGFGVANRTAIAQRKDGIVLFLVIDGRGADGSNGITIADMIPLLERYGAYNAANLDGGGSSTLVIDGELINNPRGYSYTGERYLPNAWILK